MGLKQSIVVKNQFTVKSGDNGGRRGKTPGRYVLRYMARKDATEPIAPIKQSRTDDFIKKYMVRTDATEPLRNPSEVRKTAEDVVKFGGVAFGYGQIALSDEDLINASNDIQKCFDEGKTVMKTVLSFEEDYLRENGILDPNFVFQRAGDYKGHIDQLKLRKAIMSGLDRFGRNYDDLQYVGVIQVDTGHVHCHLAMVDRGIGRLAPNGEQKGKMTQRSMNQLRRGIDVALDDQKTIQFMASQYQTEKRNVKSFVKKMSFVAIDEHGLGQLMLAALPEDSTLWRANSNNKRMQRANNLAREFVNKMFEKEGSGYREAQASVLSYVNKRSDREGLSEDEKNILIKNGYKKIEDKAINTVYETIKQYKGEDLNVHTRMMDIAISDLEDLASQKDDPLAQFGYRLRSYSSRRKHHMEEKHKYKERAKKLEEIPNRNEIANKFLEFYRFEAMYHAQLQSKYQSFLSFLPNRETYDEQIRDVLNYEKRMLNLDRMINDKSMRKMNPDNAEVFGFSTYGQRGGHYVAEGSLGVLNTRLKLMQTKLKNDNDELNDKLFDAGFKLVKEEDGYHLKPKLPYDFEDVKALDLHHLDYDFLYDADISVGNVSRFVNTANERYNLFKPIEDYLKRTEQEDQLDDFAVNDIEKMKQYADDMKLKPILKSKINEAGVIQRAHNTVDLSRDLESELQIVINNIMHENVEDYFVEDKGYGE